MILLLWHLNVFRLYLINTFWLHLQEHLISCRFACNESFQKKLKFLPASLWSFLRWNLGDPKKLFFIVLNRFFQWAIEGEPGVVAADSEESAGTKVNWMKVQFPQHVSFTCPPHSLPRYTVFQNHGSRSTILLENQTKYIPT